MSNLIGRVKSFLARRKSYRRLLAGQGVDLALFSRIYVEPCFNVCKLRCPYCPVGQGRQLRNTPEA